MAGIRKILFGVGINDVTDCEPQHFYEYDKISGKRKLIGVCRYYKRWRCLIQRCYSEKFKHKNPNYNDCTVCEEWKYLSNFIKWVDSQPNRNWENEFLDKDILVKGNKVYSPNTCVFISRSINNFTTDRRNYSGEYETGVTLKDGKFRGRCNNPFTGKEEHLGIFATEAEAHKAWQAKKHEYACQLAELQEDPRVAQALCNFYKSEDN